MKHRTTRKVRTASLRECRRTRDLKTLLDTLNIWAMAPDSRHRTEALRTALRGYQQAVKAKTYPKPICSPTAACNTVPEGSFEEFFGELEEDTSKAPWED